MQGYYLIAETAYSFEGNKDYLMEQIKAVPDEVAAIKFHLLFDIDEYLVQDFSLKSLVMQWVLKEEDWRKIIKKTREQNKDVIILADDLATINFLDTVKDDIYGIEVHAACVNDIHILKKALDFAEINHKKFFLGISGFEFAELKMIIEYMKERKNLDIVLMYGFQNYPTKLEDIQLNKINFYRDIFRVEIGYADHTQADSDRKDDLICATYASGIKYLEVHYVNEFMEKRTDAITGYDVLHFKQLIEKLEAIKMAYGDFMLELNEGELNYLNFRKVPVYSKNFKQGHTINEKDIVFKRVDKACERHSFMDYTMVIGKKLKKNVKKDEEVLVKEFICNGNNQTK